MNLCISWELVVYLSLSKGRPLLHPVSVRVSLFCLKHKAPNTRRIFEQVLFCVCVSLSVVFLLGSRLTDPLFVGDFETSIVSFASILFYTFYSETQKLVNSMNLVVIPIFCLSLSLWVSHSLVSTYIADICVILCDVRQYPLFPTHVWSTMSQTLVNVVTGLSFCFSLSLNFSGFHYPNVDILLWALQLLTANFCIFHGCFVYSKHKTLAQSSGVCCLFLDLVSCESSRDRFCVGTFRNFTYELTYLFWAFFA